MNGNRKFFVCKHCGNMVGLIQDKGVMPSCCGETMAELVPNAVDTSTEKHLPAVTVSGDSIEVRIGSAPHPMEEAHHIAFVYIETELGGQRKRLNVGEAPAVTFRFVGDKPVAAYAYCNLHGLWKAEIK